MEGLQYGIQQGYNPLAAGAYASQLAPQGQFAPQGWLNSLAGAPLAGLIGSGIAGLLTGQNLVRQPGQFGDGFGVTPYGVDPVTAYLQQIQLAQQQAQFALPGQIYPQGQFAHQGWLGNHGGISGNPYAGNPHIGGQLGLLAAQVGRFSPFGIDPVAAAYAQQRAQLAQLLALQLQLAQQSQIGQGQFGQGQFGGGIGNPISNPWANSQLASPIGNFAGQGVRQPFPAGMMGAAAGYGGLPAY